MTEELRSRRPIDVWTSAFETHTIWDSLIQEDRPIIIEIITENLQVTVVHNIITTIWNTVKQAKDGFQESRKITIRRQFFAGAKKKSNLLSRKVMNFLQSSNL